MAKNDGFKAAINAELTKLKMEAEAERVNSIFKTRMQTLDCVTIALGQMGLNPDDLAYFEDTYMQVEDDFCNTVSEETSAVPKNDMEQALYMSAEKNKIDRAVRQYVREDRFQPYDKRYCI